MVSGRFKFYDFIIRKGGLTKTGYFGGVGKGWWDRNVFLFIETIWKLEVESHLYYIFLILYVLQL